MTRGAKSSRGRASSTGGRNRRHLLLEPLCDRRVLASITGAVFDDFNDSARRDAEESGLQDRLVFLDTNTDGMLSEGEPYKLTDSEGRFAFENLGLGDYSVRLYNGTTSQRQTTPIAPQWGEKLELEDGAIAAISHDQSQAYVLQSQTLVRWDLTTGETTTLELPSPVASLHPLQDGRVVALGASDAGLSGDAAWLISFADESVDVLDFGLDEGETGWSSMAVDGTGNGVLLAAHAESEPTRVRELRWTDGSIHAVDSNHTVVAGATVLSHTDAVISLIAAPTQDGLILTQWSNATGTPIAETSTEIPGARELLAFDETSGLAVVEDSEGDLLVLDAAANMALLHRFTDLSGPIQIDGHRERLYATDEAGDFVIQDLLDPTIRQTVTMSEAAVGGMMLVEGGRAAIIGHADHLRRIRLDRPIAHAVSLSAEKESADLFFGLYVEGENAAPAYGSEINYELDEDTDLTLVAPGLLNGAADADESDQFVLLRLSDPTFGSIQTSPTGRLVYQPQADFNGTDAFDVLLHDGRSMSEATTVHLDIHPVDDPLGPITFIGPTVPENIEPGVPIGTITIVNPDVDEDVTFVVSDDPRFLIDGDQLILAEGVELNFEFEFSILLTIFAYQDPPPADSRPPASDTILLQVEDVPEPITGLFLDNLRSVPEGVYDDPTGPSGQAVANVRVVDEDFFGTYDFEVSDPRFEVVDRQLRIAPESVIDFETEPEIDLTIRAFELDGPYELTESFTITVDDLNEMPTTASFEATTIVERVAGVEVGDVSVDDPDQPSTVLLSVDDARFEFEGSTLKLRDGVFVERSQQEQIQLTLTVADYGATDFVRTVEVTLEVLENPNPFHNEELNSDVNGDGIVEPLDALAIINYLNSHGPGPIEEAVNSGNAEYYYDVNNDGMVTPLDALLVINYLNQQTSSPTATVGGEGEPKLTPPIDPEGESEEQKLAHATLIEPSSVPNIRKLQMLTFAPSDKDSPPARVHDLAVEAWSRESDPLSVSDEDVGSL